MTKEIFLVFLRLGCIAFGGPTAHLGYFHAEFVERRKWMSETDYADLIALCQFLPGPGSSQVGLSIGLLRGGRPGALAAWAGFTLPSALIMTALAIGLTQYGTSLPDGILTGLKIAAAAVVAKALWLMWRKLCPAPTHTALALIAAAITLLAIGRAPIFLVQFGIIVLAGLAGLMLFKAPQAPAASGKSLTGGRFALLAFFALLIALPILAHLQPSVWMQITDSFYRTGSMVFGGGHVVLPLLESQTVATGLVSEDTFLAGYGATQAMPGPLFTFSAFLGGSIHGLPGAALALAAIYVPSFLLIFGVMPIWQTVSSWPKMRQALIGVNAAVVGLLAAAFWDPVLTHAIYNWQHAVMALIALAALTFGKVPPWAVVLVSAGVSALIF